jgi:transcriptional regulator with XRE-family HTH domain
MSGPNRLAELIARGDESLTDLAAFCGVRERTIERWVKGETGIPDSSKRVLAARFNVTPEYLMGWDRETGAAA